ncbi:MAG: sensor histidine kinase [Planctomycetota bacterium]
MPPADSTPGAEPTAEPAGRALERLEGLLERLLRACPEEFEDAPLARWLDEVRTSLGAERASIWLRDGGARLACRAAAPPPASPPPSVDAPAVLGALETRRVRTESVGPRDPLRAALGGGLGATLRAAIHDGAAAAGVLCIEFRPAARPTPGAAERLIAGALADRLALVVARTQAVRDDHVPRLHEAQRLQALGRLTAGVAHDFNNALTVVLGAAQFLGDELPPDSELRALLARAEDATRFATHLARQLLAFGRGEDDAPTALALDEFCERFHPLLRTLLGDRRELELALGCGDAVIHAVPTQIGQILLNLVANARDALLGSGSVRIETSPTAEGHVLLAVADHGIGMPEHVRQRIFEPMFTTKPVGQGCGLGLATVRRIVEEHGATISCTSAPGEGTRFELRFPRVTPGK